MDEPREGPAQGQEDFSGIKSRILQQIASEVKASRQTAAKRKGVIYAKASHLKSHYSKSGGNPLYGKGSFIKSSYTKSGGSTYGKGNYVKGRRSGAAKKRKAR